jgi:flagellar motor switch protein FliG
LYFDDSVMERRSMAHGRNPGREHEGILRRVAIVLSSLPSAVASELIGAMPPGSKEAVRQAMTTLTDIDPLERHRAFHAFKVSMEQQPSRNKSSGSRTPGSQEANGSSYGESTEISPDKPSGSRVVPGDSIREPSTPLNSPQPNLSAPATSGPAGRLLFLEEVDDGALLQLLGGEHPQTIAVVLASISPEKAGRVLPQLDARTQMETLRRIGRLDEFPDEALAEIAEHFQQRVSRQIEQGPKAPGQSALNAILSAMPSHSNPITQPSPTMSSAQQPGQTIDALHGSAQHTVHMHGAAPGVATIKTSFPTAEEPKRDLAQKLRVAQHTLPESNGSTNLDHDLTPGQDGERNPGHESTARQTFDSTDSIAKHLESLSPAELCQALGRVETRVAMLALCGLPNHSSESALALLPKAESKKVRAAMGSLHSLNLRDIDDAKEAIARASVAAHQHAPVAA